MTYEKEKECPQGVLRAHQKSKGFYYRRLYCQNGGKPLCDAQKYKNKGTLYSTRLDAERDILALIDKLRSKRLIADVIAK